MISSILRFSLVIENNLKIKKWIYSIRQVIKKEYVNIALNVSTLFNKQPKIAIEEINVIIGLSITKILNTIRAIVYKTDCIIVILKGYFFKLLNIEKANNPLNKYLIMSITKRPKEKSLPCFLKIH